MQFESNLDRLNLEETVRRNTNQRRHNSVLVSTTDPNKWLAEYSKFNSFEMNEKTILDAQAMSSSYDVSSDSHKLAQTHMLPELEKTVSVNTMN